MLNRTGFRGWKRGSLGRIPGLAAGGAAMITALSAATSPAAISPAVTNHMGSLQSVAAVSATDAWAAGEGNLMLHWNGSSWAKVAVPRYPFGGFYGVSASSATDAWAVGNYTSKATSKAEAVHWNGTSWAKVALPSPGGSAAQDQLSAVSDQSPDNVWAVGSYGSRSALALRWNGSTWANTPLPLPAGTLSWLDGVDALSASDVWAVGEYFPDQQPTAVLLHWNGTSWSLMPGSFAGELDAVTALSPTDAWAVGDAGTASGATDSVILHWNGTSWSRVASPQPGGTSADSVTAPLGVTALSATDAWTVGRYGHTTSQGGFIAKTLVLRWNGKTWAQVASPSVGKHSLLAAVAASSPGRAWAVGSLTRPFSPPSTLVLGWNGKTWART